MLLSNMISSGLNQGNAVIETNTFNVIDDTKLVYDLQSPVDDPKHLLVFVDNSEFPLSNYTVNNNAFILNNPLAIGQVLKVIHFKNINVTDNNSQPLIETFEGGDINYDLAVKPHNSSGIIVSIDGLIKTPNIEYTLSNNNATLSFTNTTPSGSSIVVIHLFGAILTTSTILPNSVSLAELALDSVDTRYARIVNVYDKTQVDEKINFILNNAPELIESLSEISASLNNDPNFAINMQNQIDNKANINHHHDAVYYRKSDVDSILCQKTNKTDFYDKGQINTLLGEKANINEIYTKTQIDCMIAASGNTCCDANEFISPGNRGVFSGGQNSVNNENGIEYFTISSFGNAVEFGYLSDPMRYSASTSNGIGNIGLIAGGMTTSNVGSIQKINLQNAESASNFGNLIAPRSEHAATSNSSNQRGIFVGGNGGFQFDIEYVTINTASNSSIFGSLLGSRKSGISATSNGTHDRAVFGTLLGSNNAIVTEFVTIPTLSNSVVFGDIYNGMFSAAVSNDIHDRAVFAGGRIDCCNFVNTMEYLNIPVQSTANSFGTLTIPRSELASASNGVNQRGIFAGGVNGNIFYDTVDFITISIISNAAPFGKLLSSKRGLAGTSNSGL